MVNYDPIYVLVVNGADVTTKMYENSASMTYEDNDSDKSDSLNLRVVGDWNIVSFTDTVELWMGYASTNVWSVGKFEVQSITTGAFETSIKATSVDFSSALKEKGTKVYKGWRVKEIVYEVARRFKYQVECDVTNEIKYIAQHDESPINFLTRVAKLHNAIFKIKKNVIIFKKRVPTTSGTSSAEENAYTIEVGECYGNGPSITFDNRSIYKSATAQYHDSKENHLVSVTVGSGSPVLKLKEQFESEEEAKQVAQSQLQLANQDKISGSLKTYGRDMVAGNKLKITGDKRIESLIFHIKKVSQTIDANGFSTSLTFESIPAVENKVQVSRVGKAGADITSKDAKAKNQAVKKAVENGDLVCIPCLQNKSKEKEA